MNGLITDKWLRIPWVHRLFVLTGVRYMYRLAQRLFLFMRYGNSKKLHIGDLKVKFWTKDEVSKRIFNDKYWFGELHEKEVTLHMIDSVRNCRCLVDVGANLGFYSVLWAKLTEKCGGVVHAIEMDGDNLNRLKKTVRLNNIANIVPHQLAIGHRNGMAEYYLRGSALNSLKVGDSCSSFGKARVEMSTLDAFTKRNGLDPDVVKIDVEGAEFLVLSGMKRLLQKDNLKVYCEIHLHKGIGSLCSFGHTVKDLFELFRKNGFQMKLLRLRSDSLYKERIIQSAEEITESSMIFAWKNAKPGV